MKYFRALQLLMSYTRERLFLPSLARWWLGKHSAVVDDPAEVQPLFFSGRVQLAVTELMPL